MGFSFFWLRFRLLEARGWEWMCVMTIRQGHPGLGVEIWIVCPLYPMRSTLVRILSWSGEAKQQFVAAEEEEEEEGSRPWTPLWLWPMAPPLRPTPPVHGTNLPGAHC